MSAGITLRQRILFLSGNVFYIARYHNENERIVGHVLTQGSFQLNIKSHLHKAINDE